MRNPLPAPPVVYANFIGIVRRDEMLTVVADGATSRVSMRFNTVTRNRAIKLHNALQKEVVRVTLIEIFDAVFEQSWSTVVLTFV